MSDWMSRFRRSTLRPRLPNWPTSGCAQAGVGDQIRIVRTTTRIGLECDVQRSRQIGRRPQLPPSSVPSVRPATVPGNVWKVSGDLMLHGVTRSLAFDVARESGAFV